jgi:hypothetical protein
MNVYENARLTARGRETMIEGLPRGEHPRDLAADTPSADDSSASFRLTNRHSRNRPRSDTRSPDAPGPMESAWLAARTQGKAGHG